MFAGTYLAGSPLAGSTTTSPPTRWWRARLIPSPWLARLAPPLWQARLL